MQSRFRTTDKRVRKVVDLLHQSQENAFKMNDKDIEKMFSLKIEENIVLVDDLDKKSKGYMNKIIKIR